VVGVQQVVVANSGVSGARGAKAGLVASMSADRLPEGASTAPR